MATVPATDIAFDQAAIGMAMVGFDGRFLRVNPALCELVGRSRQQLLGTRWQAITHPDDVTPGEEGVARALGGGERAFRLAKRYLRVDQTPVSVLLTVSLIRSESGEPLCLFTQAVDISQQRRAEEGAARLASIVEASDDAIMSTTLDGTILSWNGGAEQMYGFTAAEMVGQNIRTLVPHDRRDEVRQILESVARGRSIRGHETARLRKDGYPIDVSITTSPIRDERGAVVSASSIARDVREQKRMVAELDATLAALATSLDEARAAETRMRTFLSDAAHHLRNPIAGIRACAETFLRGGISPAEHERLVSEMARETSRASRVIDRLLRISRLDQGETLLVERGDLVALCRDAVERTASLAPELVTVLTVEGSQVLHFDVQAVRDIVANLLDNARRHAKSRIDVRVGRQDGMACVWVSDDGPGLAEPMRERAFAPFVSTDRAGAGLGLSLSRRLARAHGGDLSYDQSAFVLRLPAS